jgi:hypothetical protein
MVWNIMNFMQSRIYINPCCVSPAICSIEPVQAGSGAMRIVVNKKVAISVMISMCTMSYITEAVAGNGKDPRLKRYMTILQHNQE